MNGVIAALLSLPGNVSGTLTLDGLPAQGGPVVLSAGGRADTAWTDQLGRFLFSGVEEGLYTLSWLGGETVVVVLPGASLNRPMTIDINEGVIPEEREEVAPPGTRAPSPAGPHVLYATREGLVGGTTANGHIILPRDHFVALPSRRALCIFPDSFAYMVKVLNPSNQWSTTAPVWDVGPWNIYDDHWNEARELWPHLCYTPDTLDRWMPESQRAYYDGFNDGWTGYVSSSKPCGQFVLNPAGIDLADGTFWDSLGLSSNAWIEVTYLWLETDVGETAPPRIPLTLSVTPSVVKAGQAVRLSLYAPGPGADVTLYSADGRLVKVLAGGLPPGERVIEFRVERAGVWFVRVGGSAVGVVVE